MIISCVLWEAVASTGGASIVRTACKPASKFQDENLMDKCETNEYVFQKYEVVLLTN